MDISGEFVVVLAALLFVVLLSGYVIREQRIQIRELTVALLATQVPGGGGVQQLLRSYTQSSKPTPKQEPPAPRPGIQITHGE